MEEGLSYGDGYLSSTQVDFNSSNENLDKYSKHIIPNGYSSLGIRIFQNTFVSLLSHSK